MNISNQTQKIKYRFAMLLGLFCIQGMLAACGRETELERQTPQTISGDMAAEQSEASADSTTDIAPMPESSVAADLEAASPATENLEEEGRGASVSEAFTSEPSTLESTTPELDAMQEMFGADCISEQTFEVQLSEYDQKVYFVPYAPSQENPQFRIQLIRDGQVLEELRGYVPKRLEGETFHSLDAVAFNDINFDGSTDILLLETYGDTRFAAVYCGERDEWEDSVYVYFHVQETLSEALSDRVKPLTFSEISSFLTDGKSNGGFSSYQEAYEAVSRVYDLGSENMGYNLIYFDEDDIPELVVGVIGYWMSMFTYDAGKVYCLANAWAYGAFGIPGYDYVPGKNSLRRYDSDMGDNTFYTDYWSASGQHTMENMIHIKYENYLDDINEITGERCIVYVNGVEIPEDEDIDYDVGEYDCVTTELSREELLEMLES